MVRCESVIIYNLARSMIHSLRGIASEFPFPIHTIVRAPAICYNQGFWKQPGGANAPRKFSSAPRLATLCLGGWWEKSHVVPGMVDGAHYTPNPPLRAPSAVAIQFI